MGLVRIWYGATPATAEFASNAASTTATVRPPAAGEPAAPRGRGRDRPPSGSTSDGGTDAEAVSKPPTNWTDGRVQARVIRADRRAAHDGRARRCGNGACDGLPSKWNHGRIQFRPRRRRRRPRRPAARRGRPGETAGSAAAWGRPSRRTARPAFTRGAIARGPGRGHGSRDHTGVAVVRRTAGPVSLGCTPDPSPHRDAEPRDPGRSAV
jgi:hypothetical protein